MTRNLQPVSKEYGFSGVGGRQGTRAVMREKPVAEVAMPFFAVGLPRLSWLWDAGQCRVMMVVSRQARFGKK